MNEPLPPAGPASTSVIHDGTATGDHVQLAASAVTATVPRPPARAKCSPGSEIASTHAGFAVQSTKLAQLAVDM